MKILLSILLASCASYGAIIDITGGKWSAFQPFAAVDTLKITGSVGPDTIDVVDTVYHVWRTAANNKTGAETGNTKLYVLGPGRSWVDSGTAIKAYPDSLFKAGGLFVSSSAGTSDMVGKVIIQTASAKDTVSKATYGVNKTYKLVSNISYTISANINPYSGGKPIVMGDNDTLSCTGVLFCGNTSGNDTIPITGTGAVFNISTWQITTVGSTGTLYINSFVNTGSVYFGRFTGTPTHSLLGNVTTSGIMTMIGSQSGTSVGTGRVVYNTNGFTVKAKKLLLGGGATATGNVIIDCGASTLNADTITTLANSSAKRDTINLQTSTIHCGVFNIADTNSVWNAGTSTAYSDSGAIGNWTLRGRTLYDATILRATGTHTFNDTLKLHTLTVAAGNSQAVSCSTIVASGDIMVDGTSAVTFRCCPQLTGASSAFHLGSTLGTVTGTAAKQFFTGATDPTYDNDKGVKFAHLSAFKLRHTGAAIPSWDSLTVLANGTYVTNDSQSVGSLRVGDSAVITLAVNKGFKTSAIADLSGSAGKLIRITSSSAGTQARIWFPAAGALSYLSVRGMYSVAYTMDLRDRTSVNLLNNTGFLWPSKGGLGRGMGFGFGFGFANKF